MKNITPFSISSPGFYGLNTQDSPVDLNPGFSLTSINCVIDQYGRVGSRKGWSKVNNTNSDLATSNVTCIGEVVQNDGTRTIVNTGGAFIFKTVGSTMTTLTYGGGGAAPTISASNWQFCQINGVGIFCQRGYDPLIYDPAVSVTQFRRLNERAGTAGTVQQANTMIAAYGRAWAADTSTDKNTIWWSDVLAPHIWTTGSSGSINLIGVWPKGGDEIVTIAAHNNFLVIFGKRQTLIYSGATTPSTMVLSDSLEVGCIARDSVQSTGEDLIFLSNSGVRSLLRTIQEKSAPLRELSANVRNDLQNYITANTMANVKSVYSSVNGFYLLTVPASMLTYCFDTRGLLENGSAKTTQWNLVPYSLYQSESRKLYTGNDGLIGEYTGYLDNESSYRMSYYTTWIDFGNQIQTSILKKIMLTLIGAATQTITFKWAYDYMSNYFSENVAITGLSNVAEYGIAEYGIAEYGGGGTNVNVLSAQGSSSGRLLQLGFETLVNGSQVSFQRIDIFTLDGKL